jgi:hypothetical protein
MHSFDIRPFLEIYRHTYALFISEVEKYWVGGYSVAVLPCCLIDFIRLPHKSTLQWFEFANAIIQTN